MDSDGSRNDSRSYSSSSQASASDDTVALAELLTLLSQRPNRQILLHLFQNDGPVSVDELAAHVEPLATTVSVDKSTEPPEKYDRSHSNYD